MYFENNDGFILKKDQYGKYYILSWRDMEFIDYREAMFTDEDPDLTEYRVISSDDVKKLIKNELAEIVEKGQQLLSSL